MLFTEIGDMFHLSDRVVRQLGVQYFVCGIKINTGQGAADINIFLQID